MDGRKQLQHLTDQLIMEVKCYGILEISIEQYKIVCNSIIKYAETCGKSEYTPELMASYSKYLHERISSGAICAE